MLRITRTESGETVSLKLEGRLTGPWIEECREVFARELPRDRRLELDLTAVSFVDAEGERFVVEWCRVASSVRLSNFVAELLRSTPSARSAAMREDEAATEELVRRLGGELLTLARSFLGSEVDAAAAIQEAFLEAFRTASDSSDEASLRLGLRRGLIERCVRRLEGMARDAERSIEELLPRFNADGSLAHGARALPTRLDSQSTRREFRRCVDLLPSAHRVAFLVCDVEGWTIVEAAGLLGLAPSRLARRVHQARQALVTLMQARASAAVEALSLGSGRGA